MSLRTGLIAGFLATHVGSFAPPARRPLRRVEIQIGRRHPAVDSIGDSEQKKSMRDALLGKKFHVPEGVSYNGGVMTFDNSVESILVEGSLNVESLRLDGQSITIAESGSLVCGKEIQCASMIVRGHLAANVTTDTLDLTETAQARGRLQACSVQAAPGSSVDGEIKLKKEPRIIETVRAAPAPAAAASAPVKKKEIKVPEQRPAVSKPSPGSNGTLWQPGTPGPPGGVQRDYDYRKVANITREILARENLPRDSGISTPPAAEARSKQPKQEFDFLATAKLTRNILTRNMDQAQAKARNMTKQGV